MAEESFQERSEQATPKRREEARKKGQVAHSTELNSVVIILAGLVAIHFVGEGLFRQLSRFTVETLSQGYTVEISATSFPIHLRRWAELGFAISWPLLLIIGVAALAINVAQVGFVVSPEAMALQFSRIDPIAGMGRLFSKRALVESLKGLFKIGIVGFISYREVMKRMADLATMSDAGAARIFVLVGDLMFSVGVKVALFLAVLAALDYFYQRWEFEKSIRMSKQEIKEELRQSEGDPQVKARIRALQRETSRKRMMAEVPKADVVITNPTHYAVALRYDAETMAAPAVVAKGQNLIAQKIRELAKDSGVPLVENPPLAQALYRAVDVGREIPEDLYRAVAEVLAYVFKLRRSGAAAPANM
jgi:flagellar biosynthetic protein FlhB